MRPSILAGLFFALTQLAPRWRAPLWRFWYDTLARRDLSDDLLFMNYGFDDGTRTLQLQSVDEPFRYAIQLYAATLQALPVRGADVLEVGSGRGGGGSYVLRYCQPRTYTGVDLSPAAIARCRRELSVPNAEWLEGRADDLPAKPSSVDILLNVESSHSYPSMPAFLAEVHRVLRPGGYFAFTDLRKDDQIPELEGQLDASGLKRVRTAEITASVVRALDGITQLRNRQIETHVPKLYRAAFRDFAGVRDSALYKLLADRRLRYMQWQMQKPS